MTKLAAGLPDPEKNGLSMIARALVDRPHHVHVVIALIDCKKTMLDHDSGSLEPTARIRRIEVVRPEDHQAAEHVMRHALEERTGQDELPFDVAEEIREAFAGVDPRTGELLDTSRIERDDEQ